MTEETMNLKLDDLDRLLRTAGPRVRAPQEMEDQVRAAIHEEWLEVVAVRRRRRRFVQVAVAAGLGAVALSAWLLNQSPAPTVVVASIERSLGEGTVQAAQAAAQRRFADREQLYTGDTVSTGDTGSVSIRMQDVSVRLDHDSSVQLTAQDEVRITSGALYVDSGLERNTTRSLRVQTPAGVVEHMGTQYEVRLLDSGTRIRVREGRIQFSASDGGRIVSEAGTQLMILPDGEVHSEFVARSGDDWAWVGRVVPTFAIDDRPLPEFLQWVSRELGEAIVYATPASETAAAEVHLRGSIEGLTPDEALAAVLSTTRLSSAQKNGQIFIELRPNH
ncbi:MAG TPA: FecR family protein [Steroidobacteraceae bacterium]